MTAATRAANPPTTPTQIFARLLKVESSAPPADLNVLGEIAVPGYRARVTSARVTMMLEPKITAAPIQVQMSGTSPNTR